MRFYKLTTITIVTSILLSGCSFFERLVYRPDINQGNYITQTEADQLAVGQTKEQVLYIMGTPMLTSVLGDDVWYYVFRELPQHGNLSQITYTIAFDKKGSVTDIKTATINDKNLKQMDETESTDNAD